MKKVFTNDELKSLEKLFQLKQETLLKVMKEFLKLTAYTKNKKIQYQEMYF